MAERKKSTATQNQLVTHVSDETLRTFLGYNMKRAFIVIQSELLKTLEPFDLRMVTYSALVMISDNPGMRQSQLADALAIERPNLVVIVDELEARELIIREQSPHDRRAYALKVTLAGKQLCEKVTEANRKSEEILLKDLDDETRALLLKAMSTIENSV